MNRKPIIAAIIAGIVVIGAIVYLTISRSLSDRSVAPPTGAAAAQTAAGPTPFLVAQTKANAELPALRAAARAHPGDAVAQARLGDAELQRAAFANAIAAYRAALAIDPGQASVWSSLGEATLQTGKNDGAKMPAEARAAFDKALAIDRNDLRAHFYLALEKDFGGQHDEALGEWIAMLSVVPKGSQPDIAIRAAITSSIRRNLGLVKKQIDAAISIQPRAPATPAG